MHGVGNIAERPTDLSSPAALLDDEIDSGPAALARLLALLDRAGDRAGALSAFETFRRRLQTEYDATPSPETDARMQRIRARLSPFAEAAPASRRTRRRSPRPSLRPAPASR